MAAADPMALLPEHGRPSTGLRAADSKLATAKHSQATLEKLPNGETETAEALERRQAEVDEVTQEAVELARQHEAEIARLQAEATAKQQAEIKREADALAKRHAEENARLEAEKMARRQAEEHQARKEQAEAARLRRKRADALMARRGQEVDRSKAQVVKDARTSRDDETDSSGIDEPGEKRSNGTIFKNLFHGRTNSTASNVSNSHYRKVSQDPEDVDIVRRDSKTKRRAGSQSQAQEADLEEFLNKAPPVPLKTTTAEKSWPAPLPPVQRKPVSKVAEESHGAACAAPTTPQHSVVVTTRPSHACSNSIPTPVASKTPATQAPQPPLMAPKPVSAASSAASESIRQSSSDSPMPVFFASAKPPAPEQADTSTPDPAKAVPPIPHASAAPYAVVERPLPLPPGSTPAASPSHRRKSSAQESARLRSMIASANAERDDAFAEAAKLRGLLSHAQVERDEARAEVNRVTIVMKLLLEELRSAERLFDVFEAVTKTEAALRN